MSIPSIAKQFNRGRQNRICLMLLWVATASSLGYGQAEPQITALTFTVGHEAVLAGSQRGLHVWGWPGLKPERLIDCGLENIHDIAPSVDGKRILIGGGSPGEKGVVQLRSWPELKLEQAWTDHRDTVYQVAWRDDGLEWASIGWEGDCKVYEIGSNIPKASQLQQAGALFAASYLAGRSLATAGVDRTIQVLDTDSGKEIRSLKQHTKTIHALAYQPAGSDGQQRMLASASEDRTVRFWQAEIGRMVRFQRFASIPRAFAWTHGGSQVIVGCDDGTLLKLDAVTLETVELAKQFAGIRNVIVDAHDEQVVVSVGAKLIAFSIAQVGVR